MVVRNDASWQRCKRPHWINWRSFPCPIALKGSTHVLKRTVKPWLHHCCVGVTTDPSTCTQIKVEGARVGVAILVDIPLLMHYVFQAIAFNPWMLWDGRQWAKLWMPHDASKGLNVRVDHLLCALVYVCKAGEHSRVEGFRLLAPHAVTATSWHNIIVSTISEDCTSIKVGAKLVNKLSIHVAARVRTDPFVLIYPHGPP
mmetsp:Transcript_5476/g.13230  ORF Transcript_5476/g.13230 Transcript_5476/m.13230 type:complete len:200 (+) Transcript_5476:390-989(+)